MWAAGNIPGRRVQALSRKSGYRILISTVNRDKCTWEPTQATCQALTSAQSPHEGRAEGFPEPQHPSPEKPQAHLLLGKLLGPFHAVIVALGLQVDI